MKVPSSYDEMESDPWNPFNGIESYIIQVAVSFLLPGNPFNGIERHCLRHL